jgi:hypothetical protein
MVTLASPGFAEYPISAAREAAIRECNAAAGKYTRTYLKIADCCRSDINVG